MIFDKMLRGKTEVQSVIILILGCISIVYPLYLLFLNSAKSCFEKPRQVTEQNYNVDYDELRIKFLNEYDRANPLTKAQALAEYFQFMKCRFWMTKQRLLIKHRL